jgi:hypothetical protein
MFAAGVWVAAGGRGARFDRQEELWGGLFFGAVGLLCLFVALAQREKGRPRQHRLLRGATLSVAPGDVRRGEQVSVTLADARGRSEPLEVGLACDERVDTEVRVFARGASVRRRQTAESTIHEEWQPAHGGTFTFLIPAGLPYSYEGSCVSWSWRVSARTAKRLRTDPRADLPIWVEP